MGTQKAILVTGLVLCFKTYKGPGEGEETLVTSEVPWKHTLTPKYFVVSILFTVSISHHTKSGIGKNLLSQSIQISNLKIGHIHFCYAL